MTDMHKQRLLLLPALLLLAGCQGLKTENYSETLKQPLAADSPDTLSLQISLDYPVKGAPEEVLAAMTRQIATVAFDQEADLPTIDEMARRYEEQLTDQYFDENASLVGKAEGGTLSWEDNINGYFSGRYKKYDVYVLEYYSFRGGAHGTNTLTPIVFNRETGAVVPETEFFVDGYQARIAPLLQEELRKEVLESPEGEEAYESLFEKEITPNGCYDVGRDGVTWYYQPYEIGPYYLGVISVTLPWSAVKEMVK